MAVEMVRKTFGPDLLFRCLFLFNNTQLLPRKDDNTVVGV